MSALKAQLTDALKTAMKAKEMDKIGVIRQVQAAIKQIEIDERIELDDAQTLAVIEKQLKQRKESISAFEGAGRQDLADKEKFEISVISEFLPAQLSAEEINALIQKYIAELGASSIKDMGKVMNLLRPEIMGKADAGDVSALVKQALTT